MQLGTKGSCQPQFLLQRSLCCFLNGERWWPSARAVLIAEFLGQLSADKLFFFFCLSPSFLVLEAAPVPGVPDGELI